MPVPILIVLESPTLQCWQIDIAVAETGEWASRMPNAMFPLPVVLCQRELTNGRVAAAGSVIL